MLLFGGFEPVFAAFSCIVKPAIVTKSLPMILKIASFRFPDACGLGAVIVLALP
jgi:hypothetical protein